jgi:uncharacterized protein
MKAKKTGNIYITRLEKGEEFVKTLATFVKEHEIKAGSFSGIGGTDNMTLGYFNKEKQEFIHKTFTGKIYEILFMNGNISTMEGEPYLHTHVMLSDDNFNAVGGHLVSGFVATTIELVITVADVRIERFRDTSLNINLFDL